MIIDANDMVFQHVVNDFEAGHGEKKGQYMRWLNGTGTFTSPREKWAFFALLVSVFGSAFSLPLGRSALAFALLLVVVGWRRRKWTFHGSSVLWLVLLFLALAVVVTCCGVNPGRGIHKLDKLLWFAGIVV
ncbi:MAG: hypothetical protein O3C57_07100, partial [Verrucomicrobia bacterium]|nr:hypothetical protein [Verrucomicrobiota bacterium]